MERKGKMTRAEFIEKAREYGFVEDQIKDIIDTYVEMGIDRLNKGYEIIPLVSQPHCYNRSPFNINRSK